MRALNNLIFVYKNKEENIINKAFTLISRRKKINKYYVQSQKKNIINNFLVIMKIKHN